MKGSGLATPRSGLDAISRSWREISYSRSSQGDRGFESCSLQRRVTYEPENDIDIPVPRAGTPNRANPGELEGLRSTDELIRLLQNKILLLTMRARTFEG
jgi:hypothetical protein